MRLGHRVTLEKPADVADSYGQLIPGWMAYRKCWADVVDQAGRELIRGGQVEGVVDSTILIRYPREGRVPQAEDRVTYTEYGTSHTVEIDHVQRVDNRGRMLRLFVREDRQ